MKIQSINYNKYPNDRKNNFKGNLIISENLSEIATEFVNKSKDTLIIYAKKVPYDVRLRELPKKDKNNKPILILIKDGEDLKESVVEKIIEKINEGVDYSIKIKEYTKSLIESISEKDFINRDSYQVKNKPYVPKVIGKPRKPFIKRNKN